MSDKEKNAGDSGIGTAAASVPPEQPNLDEHTTEPNAPQATVPTAPPAGDGKWQMPKPKFQQTSGYLPEGYLKNMQATAAAARPGNENTTQEQVKFIPEAPDQPSAAPPPAIEPQPDLSDVLIPDEPAAEMVEGKNRIKARSAFPMIALGLIGILIFVAVFLAAVWFLLLSEPARNNIF